MNEELEKPPGGGSYLRNPDGSLTVIDPPTQPADGTPNPPAETTEPATQEMNHGTTGKKERSSR